MPRYDFIDWFKAIGICLIVYGHVAAATTVALTPPIYIKQLGVALFLFVTGFTLAREQRRPVVAVVRRLFPVYLFGLALAAGITLAGLILGSGLALSNFLPFLAGANVLFDNFPANPTTWFIGTYLHLLLIWAVWLHRVRVRRAWLIVALLVEIPFRAALGAFAGLYVAYMLFTNWTVVFLAGLAWGTLPSSQSRGRPWPYLLALGAGIVIWARGASYIPLTPTFPFMTLEVVAASFAPLLTSAAISVLYFSVTTLFFAATQQLRAPAIVSFVARNSLIIFLSHMPVFMLLNPMLASVGLPYWSRVTINLLVCLPGLAVLSEGIQRMVRPARLADRICRSHMSWPRLTRRATLTVASRIDQ